MFLLRGASTIIQYLLTNKIVLQRESFKPVKSNLLIQILNRSNRSQPTMSQPLASNNTAPNKRVHVQSNLNRDMITISFSYSVEGKFKQFNLYRKTLEPLSSSLERIKLNLNKVNKQKTKKMRLEDVHKETSDISVELKINGTNIDPKTTTNIDAWIDGAVLDLGGEIYQVMANSPFVDNLRLPSCIMKNFIIMPLISLTNCTIITSKFAWYRQISSQEREKINDLNQDNESKVHQDAKGYWYELSKEISYSPTEEDIAHYIKITCTPSDGTKSGLEQSFVSEKPVEFGPIECPFEKRHKIASDIPISESFRVVTYNILADLYADSDFSRTVLFGYCPAHALEIDYRRQLLLKELLGYQADLICLQEVDKKEFNRTYEPFFKLVANHSGVFSTKGGQVAEGVATFYHNDKFELLDSHVILLSELIESRRPLTGLDQKDEDESTTPAQNLPPHFILKDRDSVEAKNCLSKFDELRSVILSKEGLKIRFTDRHTVLQVTLLKSRQSNNLILVANTHLYYAPDADHIRLLQGSVCLKYIEYIKDYYLDNLFTKSELKPKLSIIFCGDMNSTPDCGLYSLLTKGMASQNLPDWSSNKEEAVEGIDIKTHLKFSSAYQDIAYTNFTKDFNGCLDYIYYEHDGLTCESTIPLPDHNDVSAIGGIPSDTFPSDHLALVANLKYNN